MRLAVRRRHPSEIRPPGGLIRRAQLGQTANLRVRWAHRCYPTWSSIVLDGGVILSSFHRISPGRSQISWSWGESNPRPSVGGRDRYDHSRLRASRWLTGGSVARRGGGRRIVFPSGQRSFPPSVVFPTVIPHFCCRAVMDWPRAALLLTMTLVSPEDQAARVNCSLAILWFAPFNESEQLGSQTRPSDLTSKPVSPVNGMCHQDSCAQRKNPGGFPLRGTHPGCRVIAETPDDQTVCVRPSPARC